MTRHPDNSSPEDSPLPRALELYEDLMDWVESDQHSPLLDRLSKENPLGLAKEMAFARTIHQVMADARLAGWTRAQHARAIDVLHEARKTEARPGLRRLLAQLVQGTAEKPFAFRRGSVGQAKGRFKALYEIDEFELDLHLTEDGELIVQLLSRRDEEPFADGGTALLQTKGGDLLTSSITESGEVVFSSAPRELVDLTLSLPDLQIAVHDVDLQGT